MRRVRRSCPDRVTTGTRCALMRKLILLAALTFGATDAQADQGRGVRVGLGGTGTPRYRSRAPEYEQLDIPNSSGAKIASLSAFLNF